MELPTSLEARFRVVRTLGEGGFASVVEVVSRSDGARYALKLLPPSEDPRRLTREVEASTRLDHPHVIRCCEGEARPDGGYLLLELAEGTLGDWIELPDLLPRTWGALLQACEGVEALHRARLVHRDLKPSNVLLVDGVAKVADLGLTTGASLETLTSTGMILGTPGYLSPEQARGLKAGPASDVFALGVMFYQVVEGRLPYEAGTPVELLHAIAAGKVLPLRAARPRLEPGAAAMLEAALSPDPARRPGSAGELAEALRTPPRAGGEVRVPRPGARPTPASTLKRRRGEPSSRRRGRRSRRGLGGALAAVALAGMFALGRASCGGGGGAALAHPPPAPVGPLGEGIGRRLLAELEDAQLRRVDAAKRVFRIGEGPGGPGDSLELLDPDPALWAVRYRELPELAGVLGWFAAGGDARDLPEADRAALAGVDEAYRGQQLPAPFAPYLAMRPGSPGACAELQGDFSTANLPCGPWFAALVEARRESLEAIVRFREAFDAGVGLVPTEEYRSLLRTHRARLGFQAKAPISSVREGYLHQPFRRSIARDLALVSEPFRRGLLLAARSIRTEPDTAEFAAMIGASFLDGAPEACHGIAGWLPPDVVFGGELPDAAGRFLAATFEIVQRSVRERTREGPTSPDAWRRVQRELWDLSLLDGPGRKGDRRRAGLALLRLTTVPRARLELAWLQEVTLPRIEEGFGVPLGSEVTFLTVLAELLAEQVRQGETRWRPFGARCVRRVLGILPFLDLPGDRARVERRLARFREDLVPGP